MHVVLFFTFLQIVYCDFKLSDSKLLLPYYSVNPVNFTLHGSDGACYEWHSGTPEVAVVSPIVTSESGCSTAAVITAVWQSRHRAVATIYAKIINAEHIVKCDVIVDDIHRIEISTTTQELYLHNTPVSLVVTAFDEYGNTFSSLEGVPFEWRIFENRYEEFGDAQSVLRFITWSESEYTTPSTMALLESKGLQGYMQLISGLRTGSAVVSVALQESIYRNVDPCQVRLLVMANAQLSPALAYLVPNSLLTFTVHVIQQGDDQEVSMPSLQYHLQVNNTDLAVLSPLDGCTLKALNYGQTEVTLLDRNVEEALEKLDQVMKSEVEESDLLLPKRRRPTSLIQIVEPAYLGFTLMQKSTSKQSDICQLAAFLSSGSYVNQIGSGSHMPIRKWIMESGKVYVISVDIYDRNNHRLYPSDNLRLTLNFPESHFEILQSSSNQTYVIVKASSSGTVSLKAVLKGVIDQNGSFIEFNSVITGNQDVTIYSPIKIHPTSVILPWSIDTSPSFNHTLPDAGYQLRASGGCGQYRWTALSANALEYYANSGIIPVIESLTDTVVSITKTGVISALDLGESVIVASSFSNPQLCGHTIVHVRSPAELKFVPGRNEVLIPSRRKTTFADDSLSYTYSVQSADSEWNAREVSTIKSNFERLAVGLAVRDSEGQSMTDCRHLNIEIHAVDPSVVRILPGFYAPRSNSSADYGSFNLLECLHFYVIGVNVGFTEIKAVYNPSSSSGRVDESSVIVASFPVAAYRKIAFIDPASETTSVALGSTRSMLVTHGPQPWSLPPSEHYIKVYAQPDSDNDISLLPTLIDEPNFYKSSNINEKDTRLPIHTYMNDQIDSQARLISFSLRCEGIGMFEFVVEIGNRPTSNIPYPMVLTSKFTIMCDVAVSLQLMPLFQLPLLPSHYPPCPLVNTSSADWSHNKLILPNTIATAVSLVLFGSENQELESVDSFLFKVVISTAESATIKEKQQLVKNFNPPVHHNFNYDKRSLSHPMHPRPHFFITPADYGHSSGGLSIQVTIQSRSPDKYVPFLSGIQSLQSVLNAYLSPMVHVIPAQSLLLFYHPDATSSAHIHGGSGHYYLEGSGDLKDPHYHHHHPLRITEQLYEPNRMTDTTSYIIPRRTYKIQPQNVGHAIIEAVDLCFPALSESNQLTENYFHPAKTEFSVDVIGLSAINLRVIDRIQLGDEVTASIEAIGTDGLVLPTKFARLLKLSIVTDRLVYSKSGHKEPHDSKRILGVPDTDVSSESFWILNSSSLEAPCSGQFSVRGLALGTSQLMVTSVIPRLSGNKPITVQSNVIEIQVFAPLRLTPCNFNLLLGAEYELHAVGGPSQASLEFIPESASGRITVVKSNPTSVLIRASKSLGLATIRARAVGISGGKHSGKHDDYVIYSETICSIHVVALSGVRIGCPLANMNEVISQIHDHSSIHVQELSNSGESDRHFLLSCPPGRTNNCGSTPLWAEGLAHSPYYSEDQSNSNLVSPLGMAAVFPPLRFRWHLNPPEPSSVARLEYWLNRFGIDADENHSASGMILVGLKPGTVTVHLTVEPTDPSAKQINAVSTDGVSTDRLHAQLKIVILSRLGLNSPPREPQQIILSPNSQLNLIPWTDLRSDSILRYKVSTLSHYTNISLDRTDEIVTVTSDGILRVNDKCSNIGSICQMTLQIESIPNGNLLNLKQSHDFQTSLKQTLILNVFVKLPRYMMFSTPRVFIPQSDKSSKIKGLPVGGPYKLEITYHDELGRLFDAVSDDFHQLKTSLHRSDLFSAQFIRDFVTEEYFLTTDNAYNTAPRSTASFGMSIHSSPMSSPTDDIELIQSAKKNQLEKNPHWTVMHITLSNKIVGLSPSYLSLPHTNSLDLLGLTSLVEGQWICLPKLSTSSSLEDTWSSVDPSILWIDSSKQLILARHSGQGILTYSLTPSIKDSQQDETLKNSTYFNTRLNPLTYLIKLPVVPLELYSFGMPSSSLILVDTGNSIPQSEPITFPIGIDRRSRGESFSPMLRFLVQLPTKESGVNIPCTKTPSSAFASSAPFKCLIRLQTNDEFHMDSNYRPSLLPNWLSHLVLWEYNETVETILESESAKFTLERSLSTQLEPLSQSSPFYSTSTQWQCVVRAPASWPFSFDAIALTLLPKTRMTLQLVRSDLSKNVEQEENSSIIAQTSLLPLPGIKVLVPPALKSQDDGQSSTSRNLYHFWITHTDSFTQRLLIFIPPATSYALSMKELGQDKLLVRSQIPDILEIVGSVHPVESMLEIVDILKNYIQSLSSSAASVTLTSYPSSVTSELSHWLHVINEQIENIEDDAISGQNSSILKHKVLWAIQVRCIPGDIAIDTVVNVVLSLRSTGQHIEIPVRVSLPSVSQLDSKEIIKQSTSSPYFLNFSWIHLFAVIVVTLLIAIIVHIILRSETLVSTSSGSNVGKYSTGPLPPLTTNSLNHSHANGQLWSQSFIPSRSPNAFRQSPLSYAGLRSPNYSPTFHSESLPTHTGSTNIVQRTPPKLSVGGSGDLVNDERRWRQALSGNASRLRDSFDNM